MNLKVEVTKDAVNQVHELIRGQKPGTAVRVYVQPGGGGGGCGGGSCGCGAAGAGGGPTYGLAFDRARSGDEVVQVDGFSIVVDATSVADVDGVKIDFVQGLEQSGFSISNPSHPAAAPPEGGPAGGAGCGAGGCGCGSGGGGCC